MDAVTAVDWTWFSATAAIVVLAVAAVWVNRRRREWPDRLTFMGASAPRRAPDVVHVLSPGESPAIREHPPAPRIDPDRPYVFGEYEPDIPNASLIRVPRHDKRWALRQSTRRRRMARGSIAVLIAAAIALTILALIGSSVHHTPPAHHALAVRIVRATGRVE